MLSFINTTTESWSPEDEPCVFNSCNDVSVRGESEQQLWPVCPSLWFSLAHDLPWERLHMSLLHLNRKPCQFAEEIFERSRLQKPPETTHKAGGGPAEGRRNKAPTFITEAE